MRRNRRLPRAQVRAPKFVSQQAIKEPTVESDWFRITNTASAAQVHIYNDIGGFNGIGAEQFCAELANLNVGAIDLRLNSRGGDVYEGIAIHNALANHKAHVTVHVDGLAASIASIIAMAGDEVVMAKGSSMMIHEGHSAAAGTAQDMENQARLLNQVSDQLSTFYAEAAAPRGGSADPAVWRNLMLKETWFTAEEAVQAGLADRVAAPAKGARNDWNLSCFNYAGRDKAPAPDLQALLTPVPSNSTTRPAPVPVAAATANDQWTALTGSLLSPPSSQDSGWNALVEAIK